MYVCTWVFLFHSIVQDGSILDMLFEEPQGAYFGDKATKSRQSYLSCQIVDTDIKYLSLQYTFPMSKGSQFFPAFYYYISKLKEAGIVKKHLVEWNAVQGQVCPDYSGMPICYTQSFTAFIILVAGAGIGILWLG